jgi:uncharacterized membrane protein
MLGMGISGLYFTIKGVYPEVPGETEAIKTALAGLSAAGLVYVVKIFEVIAGLMLLFNFRPAFANLLLAPLTVGIMTYDLVLWSHVPSSLIPAWFLLIANIYLGYVYWDKYKQLFSS